MPVKYFRVKNWEKFQHYKDRNPPWIKLYNELLDKPEFGCLRDASKAHLLAIWMLASRTGNKILYDPAWISKRINATEDVKLEILEQLDFIESFEDASNPLAFYKQNAIPEERRGEERQRRTEKKKKQKFHFYISIFFFLPLYSNLSFDAFKKSYPPTLRSRRNWDTARERFNRLVKNGVSVNDLIRASRNYSEDQTDIQYTVCPSVFLGPRKQTWKGMLEENPNKDKPSKPLNIPEEWRKAYDKKMRVEK